MEKKVICVHNANCFCQGIGCTSFEKDASHNCSVLVYAKSTNFQKENNATEDLRHSFTRKNTLLMTMAICNGNQKENKMTF